MKEQRQCHPRQLVALTVLLLAMTIKNSRSDYPTPVAFQLVGQMSPDVSEVLLIADVELQPLIQDIRRLRSVGAWLEEETDKIPSSHHREQALLSKQLDLFKGETRILLRRAQQLDQMMGRAAAPPPGKTHERTKRSAMLLLGGLALAGAAAGNFAYTAYLHRRLDELQHRQDDMVQYVDATAQMALENESRFEALNNTLGELIKRTISFDADVVERVEHLQGTQQLLLILTTCEATINYLARALDHITTTWTAAIHGEISFDLLNPDQARKELQKISEKLHPSLTMAVTPEDLLAFYKLPCHLLNRKGKYKLAVPVPVYSQREVYSIYRHLPAPIAAGEQLEMMVDTENKFLALNRGRTLHAEFDTAELQGCVNVHQLHLCPHLRAFRKESRPSCLYLLFQGEIERAQKACGHSFRLMGTSDVVQLTSSNFLVVASQASTVSQTCEDPTLTEEVQVSRGTAEIELPQGCSLATAGHYVSPAHNQTLGVDTRLVRPGNLLGDLDTLDGMMEIAYPELDLREDEIEQLTRELAPEGSITVTDVLAARHRAHAHYEHTSYFAAVVALLSLAILASFFGWVIYRWKRRNIPSRPIKGRRLRPSPPPPFESEDEC